MKQLIVVIHNQSGISPGSWFGKRRKYTRSLQLDHLPVHGTDCGLDDLQQKVIHESVLYKFGRFFCARWWTTEFTSKSTAINSLIWMDSEREIPHDVSCYDVQIFGQEKQIMRNWDVGDDDRLPEGVGFNTVWCKHVFQKVVRRSPRRRTWRERETWIRDYSWIKAKWSFEEHSVQSSSALSNGKDMET